MTARHCSVCHSTRHDARYHRRRNPAGAGFIANGEFHPVRSWKGYDPIRAGESFGHQSLAGLPKLSKEQVRRIKAKEKHLAVVAEKRAHAEERSERAAKIRWQRRLNDQRIAEHRQQIETDERLRDRAKQRERDLEQGPQPRTTTEAKKHQAKIREERNRIWDANKRINANREAIRQLEYNRRQRNG